MFTVFLMLFSEQIIPKDKNTTHEGKNKTAKKLGEICMGYDVFGRIVME